MRRLSSFELPELRVPSGRAPRLRVRGLRWPRLDLDNPQRLAGSLQFFFYLLMFVALLAIFSGATGTGVLMLIAGAALHVVRSSLAEVAAQRQARRERGARKRQVRLRSHRTRRAQAAGPAKRAAGPAARPAAKRVARPAAKPAAAAAEEIRVSATPPLRSRRRPAVAQPGPSPARKQRVI